MLPGAARAVAPKAPAEGDSDSDGDGGESEGEGEDEGEGASAGAGAGEVRWGSRRPPGFFGVTRTPRTGVFVEARGCRRRRVCAERLAPPPRALGWWGDGGVVACTRCPNATCARDLLPGVGAAVWRVVVVVVGGGLQLPRHEARRVTPRVQGIPANRPPKAKQHNTQYEGNTHTDKHDTTRHGQ